MHVTHSFFLSWFRCTFAVEVFHQRNVSSVKTNAPHSQTFPYTYRKQKKKTRFLKNTTFFKRYLIDNIIIVILIVIMITINDNNNLIISKALHALINNPFTIHWKLNEKNMSVIDK